MVNMRSLLRVKFAQSSIPHSCHALGYRALAGICPALVVAECFDI
jgi:hypothetical protein